MNQIKKTAGASVNLLFTMLLFLVFLLCALFTVLFGSRVYENISSRSENKDTGSEIKERCLFQGNNVALHYIANKVRQGDREGAVDVIDVDGTPVLELIQSAGQVDYYTWIYYRDGSIRELFTREGTGLGLDDGLEIMECSGLRLSKEGALIEAETLGEGGGRMVLSVRSGGFAYE